MPEHIAWCNCLKRNEIVTAVWKVEVLVGCYTLLTGKWSKIGQLDPEDGGITFLRNIGKYLPVGTAEHPMRLETL
jgi:hypothetical protein